MAIEQADNIQTGAPKPTDSRYFNNQVSWTGVTEVNTNVAAGVRYSGLTVNIDGTEYWYKDGIADINLVEKESGGGTITGGTNGLSTSGTNIILGGNLTGNTTIGIINTTTLTITDANGSPVGIQYGADYKGTFNNCSLISKEYADACDAAVSATTLTVAQSYADACDAAVSASTLTVAQSYADACDAAVSATTLTAANNYADACDAAVSAITLSSAQSYADACDAAVSAATLTAANNYTDVCTAECGSSGGGIAMSGSTVNGITTYVDANTVCANSHLQWNGNTLNLSGTTTESRVIQIGEGRTDNGYSYIDFVGDTTYADYGLRIIRMNTGANASSVLCHRGTGSFNIGTVEDATISLLHAGTVKMCTTTTRMCFPDGIDVSDTTSGVAVFCGVAGGTGTQHTILGTNKGTYDGQYYAGYFDAYSATPEEEGRSNGVVGLAGNRSSGYNIGVHGMICGSCSGAGVLGSVTSQPYPITAGLWAGYFCGPVYMTTTACAITCVRTPILCATTCVSTVCSCASTAFKSGGNIYFNQGADRCIVIDTATDGGVGDTLRLCAACGDSDATPGTGGNLNLAGGTGGAQTSDTGVGATGGYAFLHGGVGGAGNQDTNGGIGGRVIIRGGAGGAGLSSGNGGCVEICSGNGTVDGCVMLYHDTTKRLHTTTSGMYTTGIHCVTTSVNSPIACITNTIIIGGTGTKYICGANALTPVNLYIKAGSSLDTGTSGAIVICGGCSSTTGVGGAISLVSGNGKGTSSGGAAYFKSGCATGTAGNGGGLYICAGCGIGASNGGSMYIIAGRGGTTSGYGGDIDICAGNSYSTRVGGDICLKPGCSVSGTDGKVVAYWCASIKMCTCSGGICVCQTVGQSSDNRIKKNVIPVSNALSMIDCLCGVCFNYCDNNKESMGLIAQDVKKILPRLVEQGDANEYDKKCFGIEDGTYGLNYAGFTPVLIEAVKEEHKCIKNLQFKFSGQEECIECLQQQINKLKDLINTN